MDKNLSKHNITIILIDDDKDLDLKKSKHIAQLKKYYLKSALTYRLLF